MTLGEFRAELLRLGIKQIGAMTRPHVPGERLSYTFMFTADEKIVFPFGSKTAYFLTLDSKEDSAPIHSEKYLAFMRSVEHDRKNGKAVAPQKTPKKSS